MEYGDLRKMVLDLFEYEWRDREYSLMKLDLKADDIFSGDLAFFYKESQEMMLNFLHHFVSGQNYFKSDPLIQKNLFSFKYLLRGRVDMIDPQKQPPLIIDWKTCRNLELTPEIKRQLGLYALMYEEINKIRPDLAIHFLRFKDGFKQFKATDEYLDEFKRIIFYVHQKTQSVDICDYPCICGACSFEFQNGTKAVSNMKP